jgi:hypothetical protein
MRKRLSKRGSILVMSIFFMLILFITASAFLVLLPVESRAAMRTERQTAGALVADAGIVEAMSWLRFQLAPPDGSASKEPMAAGVYPTEAARTTNLGDGWSYRWELIADSQTFPNGSNPIRAYTIISKAYRNGRGFRLARAEVIQESLSQYAALYDTWPSNLVQPLRSTTAPAEGPVHVNDVLRMWIPEGANFWSSPGDPIYSHGLSSTGTYNSQDGFAYYQGNWYGSDANKRPYNNSGPIASRYARMANGGRDAITAGADNVPLPQNTFEIRDAAWGFQAPNPFPNTTGVYLNEINGELNGIYIEGSVEEMELGFGGSQPIGNSNTTVAYGQNSWVKIEQPGNGRNSIDDHEAVTVLTIDSDPVNMPAGAVVNGQALVAPTTYPVGSTLMRNIDGTFSHYSGELNGVVYATGDINDLWGINKGRRTISVQGDASQNIRRKIIIGGKEDDSPNSATSPLSTAAGEKGLVQFGAVDADNDGVLDPPTTADNVLGIVGRDVLVSDRLKNNGRWDNAQTEQNPLYLFAIVLGGLNGDGGSYKVEGYNSGGAGWVYRYGSRIMVDAGAWGTTSGHGLVEGNTFFDNPASSSPPPYFPSKPTFVVKSYQDQPILTAETL